MSPEEFFGARDKAVAGQLKARGFAPRVVFDGGASNGLWTSVIAEVFPEARFEMFEPLADRPEYAEGLERVLSGRVGAALHQVALGDRVGKAALRLPVDDPVSASLLTGARSSVRESEVDVVTLDAMVASARCRAPDLIKLDLQGAEMLALLGAREFCLPHASALVIETWLTRGYGPSTPLLHELVGFLAAHGYLTCDLGDGYRSRDTLVSLDLWFVRAGSPLGEALWSNP